MTHNARQPIVIGNLKMNPNKTSDADGLVSSIFTRTSSLAPYVDVVICPSFIHLSATKWLCTRDVGISLGSQNVHWDSGGAHTGGVSAEMLKDCGCKYCIIGHSECREEFSETDEDVNKKLLSLVKHNITPIICCGEDASVRESGGTNDYIVSQVMRAMDGFAYHSHPIIIAYEPIWAIGTGVAATPKEANSACGAIRGVLSNLAGGVGQNTRILYGGSVSPDNAGKFAAMPHIDGALVGGASLDADKFAEIVKAFRPQ